MLDVISDRLLLLCAMRTALRFAVHGIVMIWLVGGIVVARPRSVLPPAHASGEALGVAVAGLVVGLCIGWLTLVSLLYLATVRTRHEYVAHTCTQLMPRFVRRLLEVALITSAAT